MSEVKSYHVLVYGSYGGYHTDRARIALYGTDGSTVGVIRFNDPGMYFEADCLVEGVVNMYLPSALFHGVVGVLQSEKPIFIRFQHNRAFLSTTKEPIGELEVSQGGIGTSP